MVQVKSKMSENSQFSEREKEVTELLLQGKSNKQIALALGISASTVEYHLRNIYKKLQVNSKMEAVLRLGKSTVDMNGKTATMASCLFQHRGFP
jgi:DNA-binding NarL/FixJ family response regulator